MATRPPCYFDGVVTRVGEQVGAVFARGEVGEQLEYFGGGADFLRQDGVDHRGSLFPRGIAAGGNGGLVGSYSEVGESCELLPPFRSEELAVHVARLVLDYVSVNGFEPAKLFLQGGKSGGVAVLAVFDLLFPFRQLTSLGRP